jgi:hypothetical protein
MLTSNGGQSPRWPGQLLPRYPEQDAMGKPEQSNIGGGTLRKLASSVTWGGVLQEDDLPSTLDAGRPHSIPPTRQASIETQSSESYPYDAPAN